MFYNKESVWLHKFTIPKRFSKKTIQAMERGVITKAVRIEIINSVAIQVLQHTTNPTPEEYTEVCVKLIETYGLWNIEGYYWKWLCKLLYIMFQVW